MRRPQHTQRPKVFVSLRVFFFVGARRRDCTLIATLSAVIYERSFLVNLAFLPFLL